MGSVWWSLVRDKQLSAKWISCNYSQWLKWAGCFRTKTRRKSLTAPLYCVIQMSSLDHAFSCIPSGYRTQIQVRRPAPPGPHPDGGGGAGVKQTHKCTDEPRVFLESSPLLPKANPGVVDMQTVSSRGSSDTKVERWGKIPAKPMWGKCSRKTHKSEKLNI